MEEIYSHKIFNSTTRNLKSRTVLPGKQEPCREVAAKMVTVQVSHSLQDLLFSAQNITDQNFLSKAEISIE